MASSEQSFYEKMVSAFEIFWQHISKEQVRKCQDDRNFRTKLYLDLANKGLVSKPTNSFFERTFYHLFLLKPLSKAVAVKFIEKNHYFPTSNRMHCLYLRASIANDKAASKEFGKYVRKEKSVVGLTTALEQIYQPRNGIRNSLLDDDSDNSGSPTNNSLTEFTFVSQLAKIPKGAFFVACEELDLDLAKDNRLTAIIVKPNDQLIRKLASCTQEIGMGTINGVALNEPDGVHPYIILGPALKTRLSSGAVPSKFKNAFKNHLGGARRSFPTIYAITGSF